MESWVTGSSSSFPIFTLCMYMVNSLPTNIPNYDLLAIRVTQVKIEHNGLGLKPLKFQSKPSLLFTLIISGVFWQQWKPDYHKSLSFKQLTIILEKEKQIGSTHIKMKEKNELCMNHVFQDKILTFKLDKSFKKITATIR